MNEIDFKVIEAYLIHGWSHRKIQSEILEIEAPERGGGFEAMQILHRFGITGEFKNILAGQELNRELFQQSNNIEIYLDRLRNEA
jgi:putative restriction endonuclease